MRLSLIIRSVLAGAVLATAPIMAAPAFAHRLHAGVSEISVNPRTGEMEIMHRVFAHDLLEAMDENEADEDAFFTSEDGVAAIGAYIAPQFRLGDVTGRLIALTYIGAEKDGEFAYIYFTAPAPAEQDGFLLDNDIMSDAFDDQTMMTNLRFNSQVRSAVQGPGQRDPVQLVFD